MATSNVARARISVDELRTFLRYESQTGRLFWLVKPSHCVDAGSEAGCLRSDGYMRVQIRGKKYLCHLVAWALQTGSWPDSEVDHRDGVGSNNAWENLRLADRSSNMMNQRRARRTNPTGLLGASRHGDAFTAVIITQGRRQHLGRFPTAEQAHAAYIAAKRAHHPTCTI